MGKKEDMVPKRITLMDKIREVISNLGKRKQDRFLVDIPPIVKKYSDIEIMKLANIENKLKSVIRQNESNNGTVSGISEEEVEKLLQWVVQSIRNGIQKDLESKNEDILTSDLFGECGFSQAVSALELQNLGLTPYTCNANQVFKCGSHGFVAVQIPVKQEEVTTNRLYLIDATYRQFFLTREFTNSTGDFIRDRKFGGQVASVPGYWLLKMDNGNDFAEEILTKGFAELTEKNAKLYGDSFVLSENERKNRTRAPKREELDTGISGLQYIQNIINPQMQGKIDFTAEEMSRWGIDIRSPMDMQQQRIKTNRVNYMPLETYQKRAKEETTQKWEIV